jgi:hypothetical protein
MLHDAFTHNAIITTTINVIDIKIIIHLQQKNYKQSVKHRMNLALIPILHSNGQTSRKINTGKFKWDSIQPHEMHNNTLWNVFDAGLKSHTTWQVHNTLLLLPSFTSADISPDTAMYTV